MLLNLNNDFVIDLNSYPVFGVAYEESSNHGMWFGGFEKASIVVEKVQHRHETIEAIFNALKEGKKALYVRYGNENNIFTEY